MLKVREIVQGTDGPNVKIAEATKVFLELRLEREARELEKKKRAQSRRKSAGKGR